MVKESIFNIISLHIQNSIVLDMFSGSGNLGIEALSRGADKAVFFDSNRACCDVIKQNLIHTKLNDRSSVICADVLNENTIRQVVHDKFNLVFLDPPYGKGLILSAINVLQNVSALSEDVLVIAEHKSDEEIPETIRELALIKRKKYGITTVSFYKFE